MTIQQAITILQTAASDAEGDLAVALNMAIETLERQAEFAEFLTEVRY